MTSKEYLTYRLLRKEAAAPAAVGPLVAFGKPVLDALKSLFTASAGTAKEVAKAGIDVATNSAKISLPALGLITAWLAYKATSPEAVAKNAPEYAINAIERESIVQTLRDIDNAKLQGKFKQSGRRAHDQFL